MTEPVPLLDVSDLTVEFSTRRGIVRAVQHVNVKIAKGETVGIVGESGSGKSVTSYAVMRILDRAGRIAEGAVHFTGAPQPHPARASRRSGSNGLSKLDMAARSIVGPAPGAGSPPAKLAMDVPSHGLEFGVRRNEIAQAPHTGAAHRGC